MSDLLEDREKVLENKYARDEEWRFRADLRAIRLLGFWVANQFGYRNVTAVKYADKISEIYLQERGLPNVINFIEGNFMAKGLVISEEHLKNIFRFYQERIRKMAVLF